MTHNRILFIDAYDSFSNNIIALLTEELLVSVETIRIDDERFVLNDDAFRQYLYGFDAVVAGPGPGHPANAEDVGLIAKLWSLPNDDLPPVLGICLGFQSFALEFGGTVERLKEPRHGFVTPVLHCGRDIFSNTANILATQYHSLHVKLGSKTPNANSNGMWRPYLSCRELVPLAWDISDAVNGPILMAVRHCYKPFWGVQYHPESICTNEQGRNLIANWWLEVCQWRNRHPRIQFGLNSTPEKSTSQARRVDDRADGAPGSSVQWKTVGLPNGIEITNIVSLLRGDCDNHEPFVLESGMRDGKPVNSETGRFSIIGLLDDLSTHIRYSVASQRLEAEVGGKISTSQTASIADVFAFIEQLIKEHKASGGPAGIPFWGGLVGFTSYEAGLESIDITPPMTREDHADVWFVFVERSIVVDHIHGKAYVQSIRHRDGDWLLSTERSLSQLARGTQPTSSSLVEAERSSSVISSPQAEGYRQKVEVCQDHLRAGSSYELCLTDMTLVSSVLDPWSLFCRLRHLNPAPFGAYLQLSSRSHTCVEVSLVSSSPERFLSWSRQGKCQFRPIKGTVKKGPGMSRAKAEQILSSPKEQAENLMIVDLIRHDLNGVAKYVFPPVHRVRS